MNPSELVQPLEYKDEDFFPCITDEYRQSIRDLFSVVAPKTELEANDGGIIRKFKDISSERNDKQPHRSVHKGCMFDLMGYFQGEGATSLVRCLKNCVNDDVTIQAVDPVKSLKGKHVMVVCSFAPSKWSDFNGERLCRIRVLSKEMASIDDFEILIVAKMRDKYESNAGAFNHFLSGFPDRLAISFDNPNLRDELCYKIDFHGEQLDGILIDPNGKIVQENLDFIEEYGAIAFPFTDECLRAVINEDMSSSLTGLLRCDPSTRFFKLGFPSESITVEQLSKRLVGLYLFRQGDKLSRLHESYRLCQLSHKSKVIEPEFEIVLFCLPFAGIDPATFEFEVHGLLNRLKPDIDASSWWVYRYDNSVGLRFSNLLMGFSREGDAMVTVGPNGGFVDFCGGELVRNVGYEAYPFSTEALVQRLVKRVDQMTLTSLLSCAITDVIHIFKRDGSKIELTELLYKNVFVYVDTIPSSDQSTIEEFTKWYLQIKQYEPDVEVVFVSYTALEHGSVHQPESKYEIPWLLTPYDPDISDSLRHNFAFYGGCDGERIMKGLRPPSVVAFGKGGYIHVLDALCFLFYEGPDSNPFSPRSKNLRRDVYRQMGRDMSFIKSLPSNLY